MDMIIKSLEDLEIFQLARSHADEISAIASRPCMRKDDELQKQMLDCSASVGARIAEGFGQGTDRHCAHFQRIARGSVNEMQNHLSVALGRKYITAAEHSDLTSKYSVLGKKLSSWIGHLAREDRKRRG
jgi:four helix bundle protein